MKWIIICLLFVLWRISKIGDKPKGGGCSGKDAPKPFWVPEDKKD
ncbi:MAG: hypothetical protein ACI3YA_05935 [Alloprevotella sp.]